MESSQTRSVWLGELGFFVLKGQWKIPTVLSGRNEFLVVSRHSVSGYFPVVPPARSGVSKSPGGTWGRAVVQSGNILYRSDRQHPLQLPSYAMANNEHTSTEN
jgi:hypothetical protein